MYINALYFRCFFSDVGDLGTLTSNADGGVDEAWLNETSLTTFARFSIVGRSLAVSIRYSFLISCV